MIKTFPKIMSIPKVSYKLSFVFSQQLGSFNWSSILWRSRLCIKQN